MQKLVQKDFVDKLIAYLLERPAKEVFSAIIILPDAPTDSSKGD